MPSPAPHNDYRIEWPRRRCWDYTVSLAGTDTGYALKDNVLRDLVIQADDCLDRYEAAGIAVPELDPARADIRDDDIAMDFSKYSVHYVNGEMEIHRLGVHENRNFDGNPITAAMARVVNLLRQDMARNRMACNA